jgi:hypothetical protein
MELELTEHPAMDAAEPERLSPAGRLLLTALIAGCLLGGVLLVGGTDPSGREQLTVAPLPPRPQPTMFVSPGVGDNLVLAGTCMPLELADRRVSVSFEVMNSSSVQIIVNTLALGPRSRGLGNLRPLGTTAGGTCGQPDTQPVGDVIPVSQSRLFTFWFRRSGKCLQAQRAEIPVQVTQMTGMTTAVVRRDVGTLYFNNNCPAGVAPLREFTDRTQLPG